MTEDSRRLYGRRQGRPLKQSRLDVLDTLLPALQIAPDDAPIDLAKLFGKAPSSFWIEIGFGNGEHVAGLLRRHPDFSMIAAEPFINGMAAFLKDIRNEPDVQDRVRVVMDDAIPVLWRLPDQCTDGIYVLNPDPWPKVRHHKRRIISQPNLDTFARILKPGGHLIMATDVDDLAEWMLTEATKHPAFEWTAESADDWRRMPEDWIETRYEAKGKKAGRRQTYLTFKCVKS
jgi:tRNA (guanine-N7-)-methyltransferase